MSELQVGQDDGREYSVVVFGVSTFLPVAVRLRLGAEFLGDFT
jgi:hypothetical protein